MITEREKYLIRATQEYGHQYDNINVWLSHTVMATGGLTRGEVLDKAADEAEAYACPPLTNRGQDNEN